MILTDIPRTYEAMIYDGNNTDDIVAFCGRHGVQVDFTGRKGMLHTATGSAELVPGIIVACRYEDDQVFRIFPNEIGPAYPKKYKVMTEDDQVQHVVDNVVPIRDEPLASIDAMHQQVNESRRVVASDDMPLSIEERMTRLEDLIAQALTR